MRKNHYDVVIIGAGISGLVCGNYLAKRGLKILIIEQSEKAGGYCTSFKKNGYTFDSCAHSLGSCGINGNIRKVLGELRIDINLRRFVPSDIIITPYCKINFGRSKEETIFNFQKNFPKEKKNIRSFFDFISNMDFSSSMNFRKTNFSTILDIFFKDKRLKSILAFPIQGNMGLSPSKVVAFSACKLYSEFMLDGGYYPDNGMQSFVDIFVRKFETWGGTLLLENKVDKICIKNNRAVGVRTKNGEVYNSEIVISACDLFQTVFKLIGEDRVKREVVKTISLLEPSLSMFILYLSCSNRFLTNKFSDLLGGSNVWILPFYDAEKMYKNARNRNEENISEFMIHVSPNTRTFVSFINCDFKSESFWELNKNNFKERIIHRIYSQFPGIGHYLKTEAIATPASLYKYTLNYQGSSYGWELTTKQFACFFSYSVGNIDNLYQVGHWTTLAQGVSGVIYLASRIAKGIIKNKY